MKIELGKVMKELRLKNGITQEKLAEQLSVTPQAVSRWESGAGYPDFETIPLLAAMLHTSTDVLFGLDKKDEELKKYKSDLMQRIAQLDWRKMLGEVRTAYEIYPGDEELLFLLGAVLCSTVVRHRNEFSDDERIQFYHEADILLNRILETSTDDKRRQDTKAILVQDLYGVYDTEKAIQTAAKMDPAGLTMQNQTMPLLKGEARIEYAKRWFPLMLAQLITFALFARDPELDHHDKNHITDIEELRIRKDIYEKFYEYLGDKCTDRKDSDSFYRYIYLSLFNKSSNDDEALSALERYVDLSGSVENELKIYGDKSTAFINFAIPLSNNDDLRLKITHHEFKTFGEVYCNQILNDEKYTQKAKYFSGNPRFEAALDRLKKTGPNI